MATTYKITDLTELSSGSEASSDVVPIVDIDADVTKKWTLSSLQSYVLDIMTISSTKLGINEPSPESPLHVTGDSTVGAIGELVFKIEGVRPEAQFKDNNNSTGFFITKYDNEVYFGRSNSSGGYTNYTGHMQLSGALWRFGDGANPGAVVHAASSGSGVVAAISEGKTGQSVNIHEFKKNAVLLAAIDQNGGIVLASMADSSANNNTMYFSTDASKPVFKDSGGTVNNLY